MARIVIVLFAALCLAACSGAGGARGERSGAAPPPPSNARSTKPAPDRAGETASLASLVLSASIDAPPPVRPAPLEPPPVACRLGTPTVPVAALVRHPERFAGAKVIAEGYVGAEQGSCTEQVCSPDRPCCNCGYSPVLLERPVERITGDTARLALLWDPYLPPERVTPTAWGCRQDAVSCAVACEPSARRLVRVQARLGQEQGYYWLRVNDYCIEPG